MPLRRFKAVVLPLLAACLALAGWMLWHSFAGGPMAGCGAGSSCDSVMGSPWAYVAEGIPVSLPAAVAYLLLGLCVLFLGGDSAEDQALDRFLWPFMLFLGGCIAGAALWFGILQAFVLHAFCKYCSLLHLIGVVVSVVVAVAAKKAGRKPLAPLAAGLAAAALFALVQTFTRPEAFYDAGRTDASLPTFAEWEIPARGPQDAQEELTLLFDFQCIHCRRLHRVLPGVAAKAGCRIRLCPVPLSSACNPYIPASGIDRFAGSCRLTRLALAVWYARPDAYDAYWEYLLGSGDEHASIDPAEAEARAREILGDGLDAALGDPRIDAYLKKAEALFGRTSGGEKSGVPRLIHGGRWLVPETDNADALMDLVRTQLLSEK